MLRLATLLCLALAMPAADRWAAFRSGPFEVVTDAGERVGRERLMQLEQFRYGIEQVLGLTDLRPVWPIRVVVSRGATVAAPALGGDAFAGRVAAEGPLSRAFLRECARILLQSMQGGLPAEIETGLADLFSTLEFKGNVMLLGAPLPPSDRNRNWARMHLLTVPDQYYGKLRVLIHNLDLGVETAPAFHNAFGKSPAEIDKEADAYFRAGAFNTIPLRRRPIDALKEFAALPAAEAPATSARALVAAARLEPDRDKAVAALEQAAKLNPRWAGPVVEMALRESDADRRDQLLDAAAKLKPESDEERARLRTVRAEAVVRRREQEAAEKKEQAERKQRELEELKQRSMASIQTALDKANKQNPAVAPSSGKVEPWWTGPQAQGKAQGLLRQVDCLGQQARLVIEGDDKKLTRLLVPDPGQVVIEGGGDKTLSCGPQKPPRRVLVQYFLKPDVKLGTAGEAAVIQFPE